MTEDVVWHLLRKGCTNTEKGTSFFIRFFLAISVYFYLILTKTGGDNVSYHIHKGL